MGTLNSSLACESNTSGRPLNGVDDCYFLTPAKGWITRCIITIFLVFVVGFVPPFLQGKPKNVDDFPHSGLILSQNSWKEALGRHYCG